MRSSRVAAFAVLFVGCLVPVSRAIAWEEDDPLAGLSGKRALEVATELSSDAMKGRKTGFEGGRLAEEWMQGQLGQLGLDPLDPDGSYLHTFTFGATEVLPPISLEVDGKAAEYGKDFTDLVYTGAGKVDAEVVFVGYGIEAKDRGWNDYEEVDVKGKVVLAIRGAPLAREGEFPEERQIGWKSAKAADHGAVAFFVAEGKTAIPGTIQEKFHRGGLPALWIAGSVADRILAKQGRTLEGLKALRDAGDPGRSFATGARAVVEVNGRFVQNAQGRNALGGIRGSDPDLRHEAVVVGAHLDHIGVDALGRVYNGADDNASGSATLFTLAETLKKNRWRPKRTVVFVWFAGEEQGLVGSRHFAEDLPFPHRDVVAMVNIDMTGQGKPEINLGGGEAYPALFERCVGALPAAVREKVHPFRAEGNSDHWPFYERGIPALFVNTAGEHPNYHQIGDDAVNLKPECMEAAALAVGRMLIALADYPEPLSTGVEVGNLVLRESPRVVEGPQSKQAALALLTAPPPAPAPAASPSAGNPAAPAPTPAAPSPDRLPVLRNGWSCIVLPLDETDGGAAVAWSRVAVAARARPRDLVVVQTATDLVNTARGGRTGLLPRLKCPASTKAFPGVLSTYRDMGLRWVEPFDAAVPRTAAEVEAVLAAAVAAHLIVDLTGLSGDALAAARAKLDKEPATYRVHAPLDADAAVAAKKLLDLRRLLGPSTLVLLSGGAEAAVLAPADLAAAADATLAPVAVVDEDTKRLADGMRCPAEGPRPIADPASPERQRLKDLFGRSFVDTLRRLP